MTDELIAFLLARYAQEWSAARNDELTQGLNESRATRDVDAKRAIVDACARVLHSNPHGRRAVFAKGILGCLAEPWASHPDYMAEWRVSPLPDWAQEPLDKPGPAV